MDQWTTPLLSDFPVLCILVLFLSILTLSPKEKQRKVGEENTGQTILVLVNRVGKKKLLMTLKIFKLSLNYSFYIIYISFILPD